MGNNVLVGIEMVGGILVLVGSRFTASGEGSVLASEVGADAGENNPQEMSSTDTIKIIMDILFFILPSTKNKMSVT